MDGHIKKKTYKGDCVSISTTENEVYKPTCIRSGMTMWNPYYGQCKRSTQNKAKQK